MIAIVPMIDKNHVGSHKVWQASDLRLLSV